jgi:hypothetical protein
VIRHFFLLLIFINLISSSDLQAQPPPEPSGRIEDGRGWQNEKVPSLFDAAYKAKPAYYAIQEVLEFALGGNAPKSTPQ